MVDHLHFQLRNIINGANCFVINCQRREACRATQRAIVCSVSWNPRSKLLRNFVTETCSRCQTRPLSRKEAARAVTGAAALWSRVWGESWFFSFGSRWLRPSDRERIQLKSEKRALVLGLSLVEKKKKGLKENGCDLRRHALKVPYEEDRVTPHTKPSCRGEIFDSWL